MYIIIIKPEGESLTQVFSFELKNKVIETYAHYDFNERILSKDMSFVEFDNILKTETDRNQLQGNRKSIIQNTIM